MIGGFAFYQSIIYGMIKLTFILSKKFYLSRSGLSHFDYRIPLKTSIAARSSCFHRLRETNKDSFNYLHSDQKEAESLPTGEAELN